MEDENVTLDRSFALYKEGLEQIKAAGQSLDTIEKAMLAGLLHDCAKCLSTEKKIELCVKKNIDITEVEISNPGLLHAKAGMVLAEEEYGIKDTQILHAITDQYRFIRKKQHQILWKTDTGNEKCNRHQTTKPQCHTENIIQRFDIAPAPVLCPENRQSTCCC